MDSVRLIDANALIKHYSCVEAQKSSIEKIRAEIIIQALGNAPTIDPKSLQPVGRWIRYEDVQEQSIKYICSNCGDYHAFKIKGDSPFVTASGEHTFSENYAYCRKCGSKNGGR